MSNQETGRSFLDRRRSLDRRVSRRNFLAAVGAVATAGTAFALTRSPVPRVIGALVDSGSGNVVNFTKEQFAPEKTRKYYKQPIPGRDVKEYITDPSSQYDEFVEVRTEPSLGAKVVGEADFGQTVIARAHYGFPYEGGSSSSHGLGRTRLDDDKDYGEWEFVHKIDVVLKDDEGHLVYDAEGKVKTRPEFNRWVIALNMKAKKPQT